MKPPVDDIIPRSFPKIKPEKGTALYFQSKAEAKKLKKFPEWDCGRDSVNTNLFLAKRELHASDIRLAQQRKRCARKKRDFAEQWAELGLKEKALKESFLKFNKFVRENHEKRERAEKRIVDERQLQAKRQGDLNRQRAAIDYITSIRTRMDQKIKDYRMYEDYLASVSKSSDSFKSPFDLIERYEALNDSKKVLLASLQEQMDTFANVKNDLCKLIEEKSLVLVGFSNKLAEMQGRYDAVKSNSLDMETLLALVQDESCTKASEIATVRTSCYNLYRAMCSRMQIAPTLQPGDHERLLLFIKKFLTNIARVKERAQQLCLKDNSSQKAEASSKT